MYNELTEVDIRKMQEEIDYRMRVVRPKCVEDLKTARAFGDLSENYEYKAAKQELRRCDSRLRYLKKMIETALKGNFIAARDKLDEIMIEFGLSGQDIIRQIHSSFFELSIDDREKVMLMDKTGEIEFRIIEGSNERIQLEALLAYLVMVGGTKR